MKEFDRDATYSKKRSGRGGPSRGGSGRRDSGRRGPPSRFGRKDSGRSSRRDSDVEMTKVVCDECGVKCEVPFKPTSSKPIYCDDCFRKKGSSSRRDSGRRESGPSSDEFEKINKKLDKIIDALELD